MPSTAVLVHVGDLIDALGRSALDRLFEEHPLPELLRWASAAPWCIAVVEDVLRGVVVVDADGFGRAAFHAPFKTVAAAVEHARGLGLGVAGYGPSLSWCTADELLLIGVEKPMPGA